MHSSLKSRSGFTIVELLIVIVVIAILAAITIVAFNGVQARAQASAALSNYEKVYKAAGLYKENYSKVAVNAQDLKNETTLYQLGSSFPLFDWPSNGVLQDTFFKTNTQQTAIIYRQCDAGNAYQVFYFDASNGRITGKSSKGGTMTIMPGTMVYDNPANIAVC